LSPGSKDFFLILLSCHLLVFSLYIFPLVHPIAFAFWFRWWEDPYATS
jgi:hypothetical protein